MKIFYRNFEEKSKRKQYNKIQYNLIYTIIPKIFVETKAHIPILNIK